MSRHPSEISLRPVTEADLDMFRRFVVEPGLIGLDWSGFRDPKAIQRRFDADSYLGDDDGRLIVDVTAETDPGTESTGLVSYRRRRYGAQAFCWEIGIALLPEWRGQGIGWRAQAIFCSYLFENTPVQRIEAATHAENTAEQRSLEKAGFTLEGVIRAAEYRAGQWHDGYLYSHLRTDPGPLAG
jgi:RimJ/RimL family protein N-acetyltransferase